MCSAKILLAMIFNESDVMSTPLGVVGGMHPPCVRACSRPFEQNAISNPGSMGNWRSFKKFCLSLEYPCKGMLLEAKNITVYGSHYVSVFSRLQILTFPSKKLPNLACLYFAILSKVRCPNLIKQYAITVFKSVNEWLSSKTWSCDVIVRGCLRNIYPSVFQAYFKGIQY